MIKMVRTRAKDAEEDQGGSMTRQRNQCRPRNRWKVEAKACSIAPIRGRYDR